LLIALLETSWTAQQQNTTGVAMKILAEEYTLIRRTKKKMTLTAITIITVVAVIIIVVVLL
jgi:hypothetical protein